MTTTMTNPLHLFADFIRDLHDHPEVAGKVDAIKLHHALVDTLDRLSLGDAYRAFACAMDDMTVYALGSGNVVRLVDLDGVA